MTTTRTILFDSPYLLGFEHTRALIERAAKASAESYPPYNVQALPDGSARTPACASPWRWRGSRRTSCR
jgi:hypothetical protein